MTPNQIENSIEYSVGILIPLLLLILCWYTYKFPPKKINGVYGYRTSSSMKSQQNWDYAQKIFPTYFFYSILIFVVEIILIKMFFYHVVKEHKVEFFVFLITGLSTIHVLGIIPIIESKIKQFEKNNSIR